MAPGPVQYRRKYELWVLVLLLIVCWPAALIYYFTRDMIAVQEWGPYAAQGQYQPGYAPSPLASNVPPTGGPGMVCPRCGRPATWIGQYSRWYCYADQSYL